jgi:tetratricopeptide (TPR) repeat protein
VVMRAVKTDENRTEYNAIGHAANLAARMQPLAPIGSIAVTEHLRRLGQGYFQFRSMGEAHVKGVTDPVNVYEVSGIGPLRTRLQIAAERGLTKFAGRQAEIEEMRRALDLAKSGRGQILAAIGEPGMGKSRLFFEFKAIVPKDVLVLEAFSLSHGKASAYLPVIELLRSYFGISGEDDQGERSEKINSKILMLDSALEDTVPSLLSVLGLAAAEPSDKRLPESRSLDPAERETRKRRIIDAIKRVILRESLNQPVVIIFEDLHWIDGETQSFLDVLADSIGSAKVLLLVNYRPQYAHGWSSKSYYTQLRLDPLGAATANEILSVLLRDGEDLLPLKQLIIEKTEGNPFFIEEMVRKLFAEGALVRNGGVTVAHSISAIQIPETVQGLLASRIDWLPASEKDLLQTMAVVGRESSLALLRKVTGKSDPELEHSLHALQIAEFVCERPALPEGKYVFKHALTQDVAYNSVLIERRKLLHERIGAIIEAFYEKHLADHADELAHHYARSGNTEKAIDFLFYAGEVAQGRFADARAVPYLTNALQLLENSSRDSSAKEDLRFEILYNLGLVQLETRDRNRSLYAAAEIAKRRCDPERLVKAVVVMEHPIGGAIDLEMIGLQEEALTGIGSEDSADRALAMGALAWSLTYTQERSRARALARESIVIARRVGDRDALLKVLGYLVEAFENLRDPDDIQERIALTLEGQHLADDLKDELAARGTTQALFELFLEQGDMQSASEQLARLARLVETSADPEAKYVLTLSKAQLALMSGRFKEGQELAYEARALGERANFPFASEVLGLQLAIIYFEEGHLGDLEERFKMYVQAHPDQPFARCLLAHLYAERGRREEAAREFESLARNDFRDLPRLYDWLIGMAMLVRVCDFLGDSQRASILYHLMAPYRQRNVFVQAVSLGSVELYLGSLAATMSRFEEARAHFDAALEFNSKIGALPWVARTQYEYARMLLKCARGGDRYRAYQLLAAAHDTAERLGMKKVSESTQALLSEAQD